MADAASDAVAEFAITLMMSLLRPVHRMAGQLRAGEFTAARRRGHGAELQSLTVGIMGMGRIGSRVGRICSTGFGARVLYHDIAAVGPFPFAAVPVFVEQLLAEAQVVSLHVPLTERTRGLVDRALLRQFRHDALLINTARGAVVDTLALVEALEAGRLAGAGLDVTDPEPLPADHPLLSMEQCIVTPHVAARTHAGLARMYGIVDRVLDYLISSEHAGAAALREPAE
jgi:phosphoglycerate dehydrogenase-like enzyme